MTEQGDDDRSWGTVAEQRYLTSVLFDEKTSRERERESIINFDFCDMISASKCVFHKKITLFCENN